MSNVELLTPSLEVTVSGSALTDAQWADLLSIEIDQHVSSIDRAELRFDDTQMSEETGHAPTFAIGDALALSVVDASGTSIEAFNGEITAISTEWRAGLATLVYEALDLRHRLIRQLTPTTTLNATVGDVVSTIASGAGLQTNIPSSLSSTTLESITFAGTDLETLRKVERLTGAASRIDADGKLELFLLDAAPSVTVQAADGLVEFEATWSPLERANKVTVHGWDQTTGQAVTGEATTTTVYPSIGLSTSSDLLRAGDYRESRVRAVSASHANELAAGTARRFRAQEVRGRGVLLPTGTLRPGVKLTITGVNDRFNGDYPISAVSHRFDEQGLVTRFEFGPPDDGLADSLLDTGASPTLTVGRVTDNADPDNRGRVKVSLPLLGDDLETDWIRTTSMGGAAGRGIGFVPEVDDEVIVAFLHGDLNDPYVLGVLWNDAGGFFDGVVANGEVGERKITGRLGNQIRLIDKADGDDESGVAVEVADAATKLFMGYNKTELITDGKPIEIKDGTASIKIDGGKVTIDADEITLSSSSGKVIIDANAVEATASTNVDITASANATLKANTMMTVEGSSMTAIKGGTVKVN